MPGQTDAQNGVPLRGEIVAHAVHLKGRAGEAVDKQDAGLIAEEKKGFSSRDNGVVF